MQCVSIEMPKMTELQQRHLEQREKCFINNNDRLQDYDASNRENDVACRLKSPTIVFVKMREEYLNLKSDLLWLTWLN
ncbi:hypothetical protein Bhyg_03027 [Pseudolycoriella hygida]|uniref:Uncharacterized protein n=1 Tax=Pseudolycoriella hygida TaxID=35572 RepID=A0A9Q0NCL9_9DIPT|nr:hypothetical protein Bhyg_03027 [Pseudolycoriella hygida]